MINHTTETDSMNNENSNVDDAAGDIHVRESVSALLDGELTSSERAFLQKRIAHDAALNAQFQRFQGIGDVLRANANSVDTDDFTARLMRKIADESAKGVDTPLPQLVPRFSRARRPQRLLQLLGGGALAAAVAWGALLLPQRAEQFQAPEAIASSAVEQATPTLTMASPVVGIHPVSGHIGQQLGGTSYQNNPLLAESMDEFLLQHVQGASVSPVSSAVYLQRMAANAAPVSAP
jgi:negative regulator of sigma E activity